MGDLIDARDDYRKLDMVIAHDSLLELRQFHREERCDDEVGNLLRAFRKATTWRLNSSTSVQSGSIEIDSLVYHWTCKIVDNCLMGVDDRLQAARMRVHPATVQAVEGFLSEQYIDEMELSLVGDLRNIDWRSIIDRLAARRQSLMNFCSICQDYLRGMRNQGALARAAVTRRFDRLHRQQSIMRTLARISFCERLGEPMKSSGLYDAMKYRRFW